MAEIEIEKKTPKWPWIILALVIIGVLIYLFAFNDDDEVENYEEVPQQTQQVPEVEEQPINDESEVVAFVTFIQEDPDPMGLDHEFTNEALLKLTNATNLMANKIDYNITKDLDKVRSLSKKITEDPFETTHANSIKEAAGILAQSLQNMQEKAFTDLQSEASNVKNAVSAIETDVLTLDQKGAVKNFFRESADLLEKMNNNSTEI